MKYSRQRTQVSTRKYAKNKVCWLGQNVDQMLTEVDYVDQPYKRLGGRCKWGGSELARWCNVIGPNKHKSGVFWLDHVDFFPPQSERKLKRFLEAIWLLYLRLQPPPSPPCKVWKKIIIITQQIRKKREKKKEKKEEKSRNCWKFLLLQGFQIF